MLALWNRRNLSGYGADTFQGPLVPHCPFQRWRTISVRVFGVVHVNDSVETDRPRASHNPSYAGLHTDTSFRILLFAYAMMKSRVRRCAVTICEKRATWLSDKAGRVRERANRPTVSLDAISLVASSCGHYRGHIEQRAAHEFAVHVATQNGLAKRIQYRHPPRAQPVAPLRERHCRGPRLPPRRCTAQAL